MKKVIIFLVFIVLSNLCFAQYDLNKTPMITIEQRNRKINETNGFYTLEDQKFNILVNNANNKTINIFAYHSDEIFRKYRYPIKCEDTVIFHPATFLIDGADGNKEITLTINREMQYNVITPEKRANNNNTAIIKIKDIADTDNKFKGALYLTVFIDFNDNNIIEENEIKNITLMIIKATNSVLFKTKIYISTMGSWIKDVNYPAYSNDYMYVKITNETEKQKFLQLFGYNNFVSTYSTINRIIDLDYSKENMYVIFTPITTKIEFYNNPYRYAGEYKLIFDTRINKESKRGTYVFCREYHVEKSKDVFELWVNVNGELRKIRQFDLY